MTAREEDILTSAALIKKGIQLDKLLESIVIEPGVNINDLVIGDKNAILLATRLLGYGPDYNFKFYSNVTGDVISTTIDLAKIQTKEVDMSVFNNKNDII